MKHSNLMVLGVALLAMGVLSFGALSMDDAAEAKKNGNVLKLPANAKLDASATQLSRAIGQVATGPWKPHVNDEKERGPASDVYPKVAPATVIVRFSTGHGSGFFVQRGEPGWIITNQHVVEYADTDPESGMRS